MKIHLKIVELEKKVTDEVNWTTTRFTWGEGHQEREHTRTTYSHVDEITVFVDDISTYRQLGGKSGIIDVDETEEQTAERTFMSHSGLPRFIPKQPQVYTYGRPVDKVTEYIVHERTEDLGSAHNHYFRIIKLEPTEDGMKQTLTIRRHYTTVEEVTW